MIAHANTLRDLSYWNWLRLGLRTSAFSVYEWVLLTLLYCYRPTIVPGVLYLEYTSMIIILTTNNWSYNRYQTSITNDSPIVEQPIKISGYFAGCCNIVKGIRLLEMQSVLKLSVNSLQLLDVEYVCRVNNASVDSTGPDRMAAALSVNRQITWCYFSFAFQLSVLCRCAHAQQD